MNRLSSLSLAAALLLSAATFAQTNSSDVSQSNSPAVNTPSKATDADSSASAAVTQACMKQASDNNLMGDDKTQFVNKCKKGKTTRQDH
jgi:hypothetical protein